MLKRSQTKASVRATRARSAATAVVLVAALGLAGCAQVPDWANPVQWYDSAFGDNVPPPPAGAGAVPGAEEPFPNLSSVPERPQPPSTPEQRQAVAEGLVSDQQQARYTDEVLRAGPSPPPPAPISTAPRAPPPMPALPQPTIVAAPAPPPASTPPAPYPSLYPTAPQAVPPPPTPMFTVPAAPQPVPVPPLVQRPRAAPTPAAPLPPGVHPATAADQQILLQTFAANLAASAATVVTIPTHGDFDATRSRPLPPPTAPGAVRGDYSEPSAISTILTRFPPSTLRRAGGVGTAGASVKFADGSATLSATARKTVKRLAEQHRARGGVIRIVGHSSERTKDMPLVKHKLVNFRLSADRAQAVANELMRRGVQPEAIILEARAANEPIYHEWMPKGEAENRRVNIYLEP